MTYKHPQWLRKKAPDSSVIARVGALLNRLGLHTICQEAQCPNQGDCFCDGIATLLILGNVCSRSCTFCAVRHGRPEAVDAEEPRRIAEALKILELRHVVITSVTRDDLPDGGASQFSLTIDAVRSAAPETVIEVLIPDLQGSVEALKLLLTARPDVVGHNLETVPRLYPEVRPQADYHRSLDVLRKAKRIDSRVLTKSGLMLGLSENQDEVVGLMEDLRKQDCDFLTLGQYLPPSRRHHKLVRYAVLAEFEEYRRIGERIGFKDIASGPFVRSSFKAREMYMGWQKRNLH